jgi:hypothetical protein
MRPVDRAGGDVRLLRGETAVVVGAAEDSTTHQDARRRTEKEKTSESTLKSFNNLI